MRGWASGFPERAWNAARTLLCKLETGSGGLVRRASSSSYSFDSLSISPCLLHCLGCFLGCLFQLGDLGLRLGHRGLAILEGRESCLDRNIGSSGLAFGELVSFPCLHGRKLLRILEVLVFFEPVQDLCQIVLWRGRRLLRWPRSSLAISTWDLGCSGRRALSAVGLRSPATPTLLAGKPQTLEATMAASPAIRHTRPTILRNKIDTWCHQHTKLAGRLSKGRN